MKFCENSSDLGHYFLAPPPQNVSDVPVITTNEAASVTASSCRPPHGDVATDTWFLGAGANNQDASSLRPTSCHRALVATKKTSTVASTAPTAADATRVDHHPLAANSRLATWSLGASGPSGHDSSQSPTQAGSSAEHLAKMPASSSTNLTTAPAPAIPVADWTRPSAGDAPPGSWPLEELAQSPPPAAPRDHLLPDCHRNKPYSSRLPLHLACDNTCG